MSGDKRNVRLDNMRKAREVWRLKMEGVESEKISNELSIGSGVIDNILNYTTSDYYNPLVKKPSYYDEQLLIKQKIILEKKKIIKMVDSIKNKKRLFIIILEVTAVIIVALIVT